jgi:hypothetical protein
MDNLFANTHENKQMTFLVCRQLCHQLFRSFLKAGLCTASLCNTALRHFKNASREEVIGAFQMMYPNMNLGKQGIDELMHVWNAHFDSNRVNNVLKALKEYVKRAQKAEISQRKSQRAIKAKQNFGAIHRLRLTRIGIDECQICYIVSNKPVLREINCGRLWGWKCCDKCISSGRVKKNVLAFMEKHKCIPLSWLCDQEQKKFRTSVFGTNGSPLSRFLQFYKPPISDTENPVQEAKFNLLNKDMMIAPRQMRGSGGTAYRFSVKTSYRDTQTGGDVSCYVSLDNIMAHNPGFYEALVQEKNLLSSGKVIVSYAEIADCVKAMVESSYKSSHHDRFSASRHKSHVLEVEK